MLRVLILEAHISIRENYIIKSVPRSARRIKISPIGVNSRILSARWRYWEERAG